MEREKEMKKEKGNTERKNIEIEIERGRAYVSEMVR